MPSRPYINIMPNYVTLACCQCHEQFDVLYKNRLRRFCSRHCVNLGHRGSGNPMYGRAAWTKETHPGSAKKLSRTLRERGVNVGDKNGMKKPEARAKLSMTRKKILQNSDAEVRLVSDDEMRVIFGEDPKLLTVQWLQEFD